MTAADLGYTESIAEQLAGMWMIWALLALGLLGMWQYKRRRRHSQDGTLMFRYIHTDQAGQFEYGMCDADGHAVKLGAADSLKEAIEQLTQRTGHLGQNQGGVAV